MIHCIEEYLKDLRLCGEDLRCGADNHLMYCDENYAIQSVRLELFRSIEIKLGVNYLKDIRTIL